MIRGIGVDIVNIERINKLIKKWGDKFLYRVYTGREIDYCLKKSNPGDHYSARFAAKEAVCKMLGTGLRGFGWTNIEIVNNELGKPEVILNGEAAKLAKTSGIENIYISLSHEKETAIAQVVGEGGSQN